MLVMLAGDQLGVNSPCPETPRGSLLHECQVERIGCCALQDAGEVYATTVGGGGEVLTEERS